MFAHIGKMPILEIPEEKLAVKTHELKTDTWPIFQADNGQQYIRFHLNARPENTTVQQIFSMPDRRTLLH
jgi:hypothetical protein